MNIKQQILNLIKSKEKTNFYGEHDLVSHSDLIDYLNYKNDIKSALMHYDCLEKYLMSFPLFNTTLRDLVYYYGGNYTLWNSMVDFQSKINHINLDNIKVDKDFIPIFFKELNIIPDNSKIWSMDI